jgi:hypothetical protein
MDKKPSVGKTVGWAYGAVIVFATAYFIGGVLLEKVSRKKEGNK